MSKAEEAGQEITSEEDTPHYSVVAEGTGKTATHDGAQQKEVYNVRRGPL